MNALSAAIAFWSALAPAAAQPTAPAPPAPTPLQQQAAGLVAAFEAGTGASVGLSAVDLKTGRTVLAIHDERLCIPASNQKLLTSAFALVRLGAAFRFVTGVFLLDGDVVVAGDGDPTLGDPHLAGEAGRDVYSELDRWAAAIRDAAGGGVRDVLLVCQPGQALRHPDWPDAQKARWYAAPVSTLNFHNNCFDVTFARTSGHIVPVVQPQSRYLRVVNRLRSGQTHRWSLQTSDDDATVVLAGTVSGASDDPQSVAVDHPPLLLGRVLADRLARAGVAPAGRLRLVAPSEVQWSRARPVCLTATPLSVVMRRANKRSLNMAAEALLLRAGDGTWGGSAEMMAGTLTRAFGLPRDGLAPADGGGLSRRNRVSPAAMTRLLAGAARRPDALVLLASLPVGGVDGTLQQRFTQPPCCGRIVAKTGTIAGVSGLSGYVLDEQRRVRFAFSVLVNDIRGPSAPARDLQEALCRMLVDAIDAAAPATATAGTTR